MNMKKVLCILILSLLIVAGYQTIAVRSQPVQTAGSNQKFLVLHDSSREGDRRVYYETSMALDYAKIAYDPVDLSKTTNLGNLEDYAALVITTENIYGLLGPEVLAIKEFVKNGGGLAVLYRGWNRVLHEVFGIYNPREPEFKTERDKALFQGDLFPGQQGLELEQTFLSDWSAFDVILLDGVKVLVETEGGQPVVWQNTYGQGRVIYWNTDWLSVKEFRGFVVQSVLSVAKAAAASLVNAACFHVDDFPAPSSNQKLEPIKSEFDLPMAEFYYQVWYPDMMHLAGKYGIKYTWIIPFNYNGKILPPWDFAEWVDTRVELNGQVVPYCPYSSQLCAQGHEMALHGYNHQSLRLDWWRIDGPKNMVDSLNQAVERWPYDGFGPLPFSYIAPNNLFDAAGLEALHQTFPSIKVIGGMAFGSFNEGANREFGPEPWNDAFFSIPRWTDGYAASGETKMQFLSEVGNFGVWTHFVHPDDVINTPTNYPYDNPADTRNPYELPWRGDHTGQKNGMYYGLDALLSYVEEHYPWLRYMTTEEAYWELQDYLPTKATYDFSQPDEITVRFEGHPLHFQVRVNDGRRVDLANLVNAQLVHCYEGDGYNLYILKGMGEEVHLKLLRAASSS